MSEDREGATMAEIRETPKGHAVDLGTLYAYRGGGRVLFSAPSLNTTVETVEDVLESLRPVVEDLAATAETDERPEPTWGGQR
jgi:hypothetical protein